jgi:hypothetical protein
MTRTDLRCFVVLVDFSLQQAEIQLSTARMMLQRFEGLDLVQKARNELASLPDDAARTELRDRLDELERASCDKNALLRASLEDSLARGETAGEQMEAIVTQLRASLEE